MTPSGRRPYTFATRLRVDVDAARPLVEAALRAEGFGVLTAIDIQATLRAKLGVEREPYLILGACNPPLANRAIEAEPSVGALLPCNIVLRADAGGTIVEALDPEAALSLIGDPAVADIAREAATRLRRVVAAVADGTGTSSPTSA